MKHLQKNNPTIGAQEFPLTDMAGEDIYIYGEKEPIIKSVHPLCFEFKTTSSEDEEYSKGYIYEGLNLSNRNLYVTSTSPTSFGRLTYNGEGYESSMGSGITTNVDGQFSIYNDYKSSSRLFTVEISQDNQVKILNLSPSSNDDLHIYVSGKGSNFNWNDDLIVSSSTNPPYGIYDINSNRLILRFDLA